MSRINWINHKTVSSSDVDELLRKSFESGQLTNYGPVVRRLEAYLKQELEVDDDHCVIATCNGALALHTLVSGINLYRERELKYVTQGYTFPSACQGPLRGTAIVDIDEEYHLDLTKVEVSTCDGIIVTQLFGNVCNIDKYVDWCQRNNKILLFDNATVPLGRYKNNSVLNYGDGCFVSLHHTKPIGFGEGGFIVTLRKYEECVRRCLNFGFQFEKRHLIWNDWGNNAKMSEISAAYILSYLQQNNIHTIKDKHTKLLELLFQKTKGKYSLFPSKEPSMVSCFAFIMDRRITLADLQQLEMYNITARKYYLPLDDSPKCRKLYDHILCLPCHIDLDETDIDRYVEALGKL